MPKLNWTLCISSLDVMNAKHLRFFTVVQDDGCLSIVAVASDPYPTRTMNVGKSTDPTHTKVLVFQRISRRGFAQIASVDTLNCFGKFSTEQAAKDALADAVEDMDGRQIERSMSEVLSTINDQSDFKG